MSSKAPCVSGASPEEQPSSPCCRLCSWLCPLVSLEDLFGNRLWARDWKAQVQRNNLGHADVTIDVADIYWLWFFHGSLCCAALWDVKSLQWKEDEAIRDRPAQRAGKNLQHCLWVNIFVCWWREFFFSLLLQSQLFISYRNDRKLLWGTECALWHCQRFWVTAMWAREPKVLSYCSELLLQVKGIFLYFLISHWKEFHAQILFPMIKENSVTLKAFLRNTLLFSHCMILRLLCGIAGSPKERDRSLLAPLTHST